MKCTRYSFRNIKKIVILSSLFNISLIFETFSCYSHRSASFSATSLTDFQRFPPSPEINKNLHYRMTKFCGNFYLCSYFFNILNPFPNHFFQQSPTTGSIEMTLCLKLCKAEGSCLYHLKGIKRAI